MLIPWVVLVPVLGSVACMAAGNARASLVRWIALAAALVAVVVTLGAIAQAQATSAIWLPTELVGVGHSVLRLDGLAAPFVALTALLGVVSVLASWRVSKRPASFFALLMALQAAVATVFLADDLVLFYVAWEAVLVPMFFLIGSWGYEERRKAALKFFLYTFAGSALMLIGLITVIVVGGSTGIEEAVVSFGSAGDAGAARLVFWLLLAGFAVKIPMWPLHTWLPDAHVQAPTAGSIMLAGVLLKMGGYGLIRIGLPLAPEAATAAAPVLAALGIFAILYGAMMALAQTDLKRLVAYSSVSHMGFVVLAIAVGSPLALGAAVLGMVAHGVVAALLFLLVGMLQTRTHTRDIARFGGLIAQAPAWGWTFVLACLASLGLPGLAGFPGEFATFIEGFRAYGWWMAIAAIGVVLAGAYNLRAVRSVAHGPLAEEWNALKDLDTMDWFAVSPLAVALVALGVWPAAVTALASPILSSIATLTGRG